MTTPNLEATPDADVQAGATRRTLLLGVGAVAAFAGASAQAAIASGPSPTLLFEVLRNGRSIGRHQVAMSTEAGRTVAEIHADLLVKFGPVPVFRYAHHCVESWRGDAFVGLDSQSTTNGKSETLAARPTAAGVSLATAKGMVSAPAGCLPMTHWRQGSLERGLLFNPQTGVVMREAVTRADGDVVALASGERTPATRYSLSGVAQVSDWYDAKGVWTALKAKGPDGSTIEYRRMA